ncbi:MAG: hypothetical protein KAS64_00915 [Spirochaetes bacterium]|nr:hypothetical protein [Spirochaetota bacterium]
MNISDQYFELILNELKEVQKLCSDANSPEDKLYFFSASYGILNRVMNFYCEPTLVFMHQILQATHQAFSQRLSMPKKAETISNSFPNKMWESLFSYFSLLILEFEKKDENKIREVLEKFSNLSYSISGNGFYLYLREKLVI